MLGRAKRRGLIKHKNKILIMSEDTHPRGRKDGASHGVGMPEGLRRNRNTEPCSTEEGSGKGTGSGQGKGRNRK